MPLFRVIRQVVPDRVLHYEEGDTVVTPGLTQVVWEGRSRYEGNRQLDMARNVEAPKGTICLLHEGAR